MTAFLLFAATFAVVFLLGLQQLNVERRHKLAAFLTSPLIALATLVLFKLLPFSTTALEIGAHLLGGALGIVAGIWMHPHLLALFGVARAAAAQPANAHAQRLGETLRLATELADEAARSEIETECPAERMGRHTWYDTGREHELGPAFQRGIGRAVDYLDRRRRLVRHPQQQHLVRFAR